MIDSIIKVIKLSGSILFTTVQEAVPMIKNHNYLKIDKEILENLTKYDDKITELIKKSYKNKLIDFCLILIMLIFSFKAKKESHDILLMFLISAIYLYSLFIILRRYFSLVKLYRENRQILIKYLLIWKSTNSKKISQKKKEFIELVYIDFYNNKLTKSQSKMHDVANWVGLIHSKEEFLERILYRINLIYKNSLRRKIISYLITVTLIFIISYAIKDLLIDVNTGFSFLDYIVYPFKQLYSIWFK